MTERIDRFQSIQYLQSELIQQKITNTDLQGFERVTFVRQLCACAHPLA